MPEHPEKGGRLSRSSSVPARGSESRESRSGRMPPVPGHTLIVEPDDGRTAVLAAIEAATSSVDLTIYELSDPAIVSALIAAQGRRVQVRVLYNWFSFSSDDQTREVLPTVNRLRGAGVACQPAPREFEVTHEKAFVIDGESALVLTFNLTNQYFGTTRDFGIVTTMQEEVSEIAAVFQADWNNQSISPTVPTLVWSPVNSRARLTALMAGAQKTLDVYCEEIDDPRTLDALVAASKRGVRVRVITAVLAAGGTTNGNARGITYLNAGGVDAVSKSFPISTPKGPVPLYMHAKAIVADQGTTSARAFVGSENLSCVSLDDNRECGILVSEPAILDRIESTFASDWAKPSVRVTPDSTPLTACPGSSPSRKRARLAGRP